MTTPFAIHGLQGGQDTLLGIWQPLPPAAVAFSTSQTPADDRDMIWSVSLPGDPAMAAEVLDVQAQALQATRQALVQSEAALRDLPVPQEEAVAFALEQPDADTSPEATLRRHLAQLQGEETALSFGLFDGTHSWSKAVAAYQDFVRQVVQLLHATLCVETRIEGALHALTRVGFKGDICTTWMRHRLPHHMRLHHRMLSLTLESRRAVFHLLTQATAGAAVLAAKCSLPGGAIMAAPAAWRYIQDVIEQSQKVASLHQQMTHEKEGSC